jgi:PKD repeat protein
VIESSSWNFADGDSANGQSVSHSYGAAGTYTVVHTVEDNQGLSSVCTSDVQVNFVGSDPTCSFTFSQSTGSFVVSFDASASTDNDESGASITTYDWNFGDGSTLSTQNPGTSHNYTSAGAGSYVVNLTVTDDEGAIDNCANQTVTVPGS